MGFRNSGASSKPVHTPPEAISLLGIIRSTFPQPWRVPCYFKEILHYSEKQQVNVPSFKMCLRHLLDDAAAIAH